MSLLRSTVKNVGFVYTSIAVSRALGLVSTIILARLLFPSDFGILALAGFVTGLISQFSDFGIGMALVQRKDNVDEAKNAAFYMYIIMGILLYIVAFFAAPFAAQFFNEPVIQQVIRISGIGLIINSIGVVNRWLLFKELKFKKITIVDILRSSVTVVITIILAFYGFSFWSIVYGSLAGSILEALLLWAVNPWRPRLRFNKQITKELFHFGKYVFMSTIFVFFILNIDNVTAGRVLGTVFVGYYMLAFRFGNYSTTLVTHVVSRVIFPTFAKIQDDLERLRKAYLMQLKYVSMISIPMAFGTFAIASEFVTIVLGEKWTPVIPLLQILCFYGLFRSLQSGAGNIFYAVGKPQYSTKILSIELLGVLLFIYPMTLWYGLVGLSLIMTFGRIFELIYALALINKILNLSFISQIKIFSKPLLSSIIMLIAIYLLRTFVFDKISLLLHLIGDIYFKIIFFTLLICVGITTYSISMYISTNGEVFEEAKEIISRARSQ